MNTYRKILIFIILLAMLASGCSNQVSPPTATPTMGPVDVVKAYEDAFNSHDVPATMAWLTEDVSFSSKDAGEFPTRQEVQKIYEFYLAGLVEVHYTDCQTSAATVTCEMTYTEPCSRAFGFNAIPGVAVFTTVKDKIQKINWAANEYEMGQFWAKWEGFMYWFKATYPDEWTSTTATGDSWLSSETGTILTKRCPEYGETLK